MIKSKFKKILLVWPIILVLGIYGHFSYERQQLDKKLLNADGLVWKAGEKHYTVQVDPREDGELLHMGITVAGPENNEIFKTNEIIDRDMFGGGFVRAVQVDQDPENEIVVWHARDGYYLDFSEGHVNKVSFDRAPQQVKDLAKSWHRYNVTAGVEMTLLFLFVLCYYILYVLVKGILKLFKRNKTPSS